MIAGIPELKLQFLLSELEMTIDIQFKIRYAVNYAWYSSAREPQIKSSNFCCDEVRKVVQQYGLEIYQLQIYYFSVFPQSFKLQSPSQFFLSSIGIKCCQFLSMQGFCGINKVISQCSPLLAGDLVFSHLLHQLLHTHLLCSIQCFTASSPLHLFLMRLCL